jgi:SAM-dependent methyltransferase
MKIEQRYLDESYLLKNPDWDRADSPWKAKKVLSLLEDHNIIPNSICEVGCGSGDTLACLAKELPNTRMTGFDISPQAAEFWKDHQNLDGVEFLLGDFHKINQKTFDVLLMLDVFEHVRDPFTFLEASRCCATYFVFHIPLDLSASSVARGAPLLMVREKTGHLHYYTKDLALATLRDTGYEIVEWRYTEASLNSPNRSRKTRVASIVRRLAYAFNKDFGVRLLGGETLLVLAKSSDTL